VAVARLNLDGPVAVAYDASEAAEQALEVVRKLEAGRAAAVTVLVSAATEQLARRLAEQARGRLVMDNVTVRWTGGPARTPHPRGP
jgi:hypothetical protein